MKAEYGSTPVTVLLDKSYKIKSNIDLPSNFHLIGIHGARILPDAAVLFNAANCERITIVTPFHGFYTDGVQNNMKIYDSEINAGNYGILLNNHTSGTNLDVIGNVIKANADPIEINTTAGTFYGIKIIGNRINALGDSSTPTSGFAIGIARGKDIVIANNIIEHSRNEAVHIESVQERILITGNVLKDCLRDGIRLINESGAKPVVLTNNQIKQYGNAHSGKGIYLVYDQRGTLDGNVLSGNIIEGFAQGIDLGANSVQNIESCTIINCQTALTSVNSRATGTITVKNCPILASGGSGAVFGKIISLTEPQIILQYSGTKGYQGTTIAGFSFQRASVTTPKGGYTNYSLFKLPTAFDGRLTLRYANNFDRIFCSANVTYTKNILKINHQWDYSFGVTAAPVLKIINDQLVLNFYSADSRNVRFRIDFDGVFYQE
ncbi:right-handed parallel beta-helix repeat-containing protein [Sporolactobacillus shoreicorticis]|uniref:Right-handed parallel beta-helix repeat-containing protein n=1 Tax=Sporolactobacillus shoreicorticis TaxID=1923877 RepID=A0ABW5S3W5_9BACL|nr:right-handed parallel beta-helix repeat-containing protein [Sporolactobacillus shoreicorticis]MCO7124198.1 right-handed parallel beta-helix repeat-containing protein [Sporolactobacillus shoreicorticis]